MGVLEDLQSTTRATRLSALEQRKKDLAATRDAAIASLEAQIATARQTYADGEASAISTVNAKDLACDAALATSATDTIPDLVAAYVEDPSRANALAIASAWQTLDASCMTQVGAPLSPLHLQDAFIVAKSGEDTRLFNRPDIDNWNEGFIGGARRAFLAGNPIDIENALRRVESDVTKRLGAVLVDQAQIDRFDARHQIIGDYATDKYSSAAWAAWLGTAA